MFSRSIRATRTEARQPLPGDDLIPKPVHGLPPWISQRVIRVVHFVMERKQLIGMRTALNGQPLSRRSRASRARVKGSRPTV